MSFQQHLLMVANCLARSLQIRAVILMEKHKGGARIGLHITAEQTMIVFEVYSCCLFNGLIIFYSFLTQSLQVLTKLAQLHFVKHHLGWLFIFIPFWVFFWFLSGLPPTLLLFGILFHTFWHWQALFRDVIITQSHTPWLVVRVFRIGVALL